MTHPLSKYWEQPPRKNILVDDTHAVMTHQTFSELKNYSLTQPTGAYEGKMWKSRDRRISTLEDGNRNWVWLDTWTLCWYGPDPTPGWVSNNYREILIID